MICRRCDAWTDHAWRVGDGPRLPRTQTHLRISGPKEALWKHEFEGSPVYREQVQHCRDLVRLTDELRRRLTDMAAEFDEQARRVANPIERPRTGATPLAPSSKETIEPLTLSIKDAAPLLGLGRSTIYRLIGDEQLDTVKIGNRTLIRTASVRRLVEPQD